MHPLRLAAFLSALSVSSLWSTSVRAQDLAAATATCGVQQQAGHVWAGGTDYSARFDDRGVEFTPALGAAPAKPFPLRFTLDSVRRGANDVFVRTSDAPPLVDGNQVRYAHRDDLVEVYDVRAGGIEQSFVFARRPVGRGDLVVRGRIATELPLAAATDDGLRYELPGAGGVSFGAVTGIDANGATVRGSIRVCNDGSAANQVEWVLPAAFVDGAAYPLVLDPLIGSAFPIGNGLVGTDEQPQVAFDRATGRYLVVWSVVVSASLAEVRGQFVSSAGAVIGGQLLIASSAHTMPPKVANVANTGRFLVVSRSFSSADTLQLRSVDAGTASMSAQLNHGISVLGSISVHAAHLAGDRRTSIVAGQYDDAILMIETNQSGSFGVTKKTVQVGASGTLVVGSQPTAQSNSWVPVDIAISADGGSAGRWLVASEGFYSGLGSTRSVYVLDASLNNCGSVSLPNAFVSNLAVANRDGNEFAVAWQWLDRIYVCPVTWSGSCGTGTLTLGTPVDPFGPGLFDDPAIAFARDKYVVAVRHRATTSSPARVRVMGIDPATCATCGSEVAVNGVLGAPNQKQPAIASRWSGGDTTDDEALVVWSDGEIHGRRFEARGNDVVTSMGGACSVSGFSDVATYNGDAVLGSTDFELVLFNPVSLPLVMVVGFSANPVPCGSCTIVPSLDVLVPAVNPMPLSIPCDPLLVGVDLYTQWVLLKPSDCPVLPDFAFSNALRFTIRE